MISQEPTPQELREFMEEVRGGNFPQSCLPEEISELGGVAARPPAGMHLYKYGSRSVVGGYTLKTGLNVALKYYFPSNIFRKIGYRWKGSRCEQSWLAGLAFGFVGIPTPAPFMMVETKGLGGLAIDRSFLATENAGGISLSNFVGRHQNNLALIKPVAERLRSAFSRMGQYGIVHGDMKASNILVDESSEDMISFIDLDAASFLLSKKEWIKGFAKDCNRFKKNWQSSPEIAGIFADVFNSTAPPKY